MRCTTLRNYYCIFIVFSIAGEWKDVENVDQIELNARLHEAHGPWLLHKTRVGML